jgi:malate dehydrogenase (oxaloacetate-decarboxylating)
MKIKPVKYTVEEALAYHANNFSGGGKIEVISKVPARNAYDLTLAYTPGVADPCKVIEKEPEKVHDYTIKDNMVAVVSDGTAILGLGNIGPAAGMPVMEGKAVLFKMLGGVDAFPLCISTTDTEEIINFVKWIEPTFGGINLEDISAPRCFDILARLRKELDIPVFHDDQQGTAVVVLAGLLNALKIVGKKLEDVKIAVSGAGASGICVTKFVMTAGVRDAVLVDTRGIIYEGRKENMNPYKEEIARVTNREKKKGTIAEALEGVDVFIGLSAAGLVKKDMVRRMEKDPVVFAMANPVPEIMPEEALEAGAKVVASGRSDYPNQINNVLGFPGVFRGALDSMATDVNEEMMFAASKAISDLVTDDELREDYIITHPVDPRVMPAEAAAVAEAAVKTGVARKKVSYDEVHEHTKKLTEVNRERYDMMEEIWKKKGIIPKK